ncbi:MAG: VCBS repeat-containing protein [Planctomycetota bacterium]|nr:VCBS repeat-containing protein [Planctomycetota bacterium]
MIEPSILVAWMSVACALPLAAACGDAPPAAQESAAVLRARLEFDTGEARATGLLAFDLDGDGRDELVSAVRGPGAIRVWSGLTNRATGTLRSVEHPIGDYALGPVRLGDWKPGRNGGPALVAVAQRADPALVLVDVRALFLGTGDPAAGRVELASRPRALASGDLGRDGIPELAVVTLDDELLLVRAGAIVARQKLQDEQTTCVHFTDDGSSILVGSQVTRRITRYVPGAEPNTFRADGAAQLEGLPRRIDEIDGWRGAPGTRFLVASGDGEVVWLTAALAIERTEKVAAVPIDALHAGAAPKRTRLTISVHGQEAAIEREDGTAPFATYAGQHPTAGALGDFDGDGLLDVALANGDAKRIGIVFAKPEGGWNVAHFARSGRSPHSIDVADFDGDGKPDVVALCALDATIRVHLGTQNGLSAGTSQGYAEGANRVRARDLDGDGHQDIAFLRETDRGIVLDAWFGDGTGRLWMRGETKPLACATSPGDLLLADLELGGGLEAVVTDPNASRVIVVPIENPKPGSMRFGEPRAFDIAGAPRDLALVSTEKGASTIAVTLTATGPRSGWCTLRATRTDLTESFHQPMTERARGCAANAAAGTLAYLGGDDGPSVLSLFEREAPPGQGLTLGGQWPTGLRAFAVRCGDLDGDGRGDVVVPAQNSHQVNLWLSRNGDGNALTRMPDLGVGTGPLDTILVDLDGDGSPEIVTACAFSDEIAVVKLR